MIRRMGSGYLQLTPQECFVAEEGGQVVGLGLLQQQRALFTSLTTGDASSKLVESYRLHPNAIKGLARCGQAQAVRLLSRL